MLNVRYWGLFLLIIASSIFIMTWQLDQVDIEASEDIYISDIIGLFRNDPYMSPRHHLRKPHAPASPHPFFVPWLGTLIFQLFSPSIFTSRLPSVLAVILTCGVLMLFSRQIFRSSSISLLTGILFISSPLVIRYGRMMVLDPTLMFIQTLGAWWFWNTIFEKHNRYLFATLAGFATALSISSKLTGLLFLHFIIFFFSYQYIKKREVKLLKLLVVFIISCGITFILLNDPGSYIYGWIHFSVARGYTRISIGAFFKGLIAFNYWFPFLINLIGWEMVGLLGYSLKYLKLEDKKIFFVSWIGFLLSYLLINPIHITGLSSEWAYLPLIAPLTIISAWSFYTIWNKYSPKIVSELIFLPLLFYVISMLPLIVWYGWRVRPLPLPNLSYGRNAVLGDLAVTKIVQTLNQEKQPTFTLIILKGVILPLWLLKDNITTEPRYHPLSSYNYIVTDNLNLVEEAKNSKFVIFQKEKNPSEPTVYLLKQ